MDEKLISKKDLLEQTDITYGQLYRWKRKNLIPEEWFIRKSTFTGQETFFPADKIINRINKIKELKDNISLDELAQVFSPPTKSVQIDKSEFLKQNIVSKSIISLYEQQLGAATTISFQAALYMYLVHQALDTGEISWDEACHIIQTLHDHYSKLDQKQAKLVVLRKMGVASVLLVANSEAFYVDEKTKIALQINIVDVAEELLNKLVIGGL